MADTEALTLAVLPDEVILEVFAFLSYTDLNNCGLCCHRLRGLSLHDPLWKLQCMKYWLVDKCPASVSWYGYFIKWFQDFGRYVDVYADLKRAWKKITTYTEQHIPSICVIEGTTEEELDQLEADMELSLPTDLRCSYRIHNGQKLGRGPGLMGSMAVSSHYWTQYLLPINMACNNIQRSNELGGCLPLTFCFQLHTSQMIALSREAGYSPGQIFYPCAHGAYSADSELALMDNFLVARSFKEWLCTYADELHNDVYKRITVNGVNQIFKFYRNPQSTATTGSITVDVMTAFSTELSTIHPPHFTHIYHITMRMSPDADESESCRLETRHWVIEDEDGHQEVVDGAGVVGEFPVMTPGAEFSWTSMTSFSATYGSMHGHFTMRNLHTGRMVDVECPTFYMKCLPYQTSAQRRPYSLPTQSHSPKLKSE